MRISYWSSDVCSSDLAACAAGDTSACDRIIRDGTGTITTVYALAQNIAKFETSGFDLEMSYRLPLSSGGSLNFRALATYVDQLITAPGSTRRDVPGNVGDSVLNGLPNWRGILCVSYQTEPRTEK